MLLVRDSRPAPIPAPSAVDLLAQLIEGQAAINRRLDAIESAQESAATRLESIECYASTTEDVRILVDQTVIPAVRDMADHLGDIGDSLFHHFTQEG